MKKSLVIILLLSIIIVGCKKTDEPKNDDTIISNQNIRVSGIIKFPTGMNQNAGGYSVNSFISDQTLTSNSYSVEVVKNDYNIQYLTDQTDKDIMLGFTYPNQTDFTIDASSTILALTMKLPSVNSLSNTGKQNFITKLKSSNKFSSALIAVENHIRAGKDIFDNDLEMQSKISELFDQASLRSGFGFNGQAYITKAGKTITIGNPGVSFAQVVGIYNNNQRISKLNLDRYQFFATSISDIFTTFGTTPNPIEQSYTVQQDGIYNIRVRNGGFNPFLNDVESKEAYDLNLINIVLDYMDIFLPDDRTCKGKIVEAVKTKVALAQNLMSVSTDKTAYLKITYNITKEVLDALAIGRYCTTIKPGGYKYVRKILKLLSWLDKVGTIGTNLNTGFFLAEYFIKSKSSLDTTIIIGNPPLLTLTTNNISTITATTAISGGNVTDDGGNPVTARGVCWSTSQNPTISNSKTTNGIGSGSFTSNINGLTANTTYYVRAYATNSAGTAYGSEVIFSTTAQGTGKVLYHARESFPGGGGIYTKDRQIRVDVSDINGKLIASGTATVLDFASPVSTTCNGGQTGDLTLILPPGGYYTKMYQNNAGIYQSNVFITANGCIILPL